MIYIAVMAIVAVTDILLKNYIERYYWNTRDRYILGGTVCITNSHNKGGFMNMLENSADIFRKITYALLIVLTVLFALAFSRKKGAAVKMGLALILGGALSNESDRLLKGSVTDYFSIEMRPVKKMAFNIGDLAIFVGAALICVGYGKKR